MATAATLDKPAKPPTSRRAQPALIPARIVPSAPKLIELGRLRRADENVRHSHFDEGVDELAADITAHGLLQSLIGYEQTQLGYAQPRVHIVGGGRRLKALHALHEEGLIDIAWSVPVLIRAKDEAVELSLAENLQQRTMSPVDEFFAFKTLMDTGRFDAASLAKRFGYTERVVKQRLRLAELDGQVLDALSDRKITLDAAMAYATSQDRDLQRDVFRQHNKAGFFEAQRPDRIKRDLRGKGMDTGNRLFKFVGEAAYEAAGGGYEDDLFSGETAAPRGERQLSQPHLVETLAHERIDKVEAAFLRELGGRRDLSPTIAGLVRIPGLIRNDYAPDGRLGTPDGFVEVRKHDLKGVWSTIRNNRLPAHVAVGIDTNGVLALAPGLVFVPKQQREAVDPQAAAAARTAAAYAQGETPEQRAARERQAGVEVWQKRLAVGPFAGTPFEGRAFWPPYAGSGYRKEVADVWGWMIPVEIFCSDAAIAAERANAEAEYDRVAGEQQETKAAERAARAAREHRVGELLALPAPAVVIIDGEPWRLRDNGSYQPDGDDFDPYGDWDLLARGEADAIDATYATVAEFDAAVAEAQS